LIYERAASSEAAYATFQRARKDVSSEELLQQVKGISRTLSQLEKSIGPFKL
jgi:hypothetical protein